MWIYGNGGHSRVVQSILPGATLIDDADPALPWKDSYVSEDGIVAIGDNRDRARVVARLVAKGVVFRCFFAGQPSPGTVVMRGAVVQPGAQIGEHCIINTCASVDHDCKLGAFVHIAPGAHLCGNVTVMTGAFLGAGTIVTPGVTIGPWLRIRAGSVLTRDCFDESDVAALRGR